MGVIDRLAAQLVGSDVPLDRPALEAAIGPLAAEEAPLATPDELAAVVAGLVGLGPLEGLVADPEVSDVLVNGPDEVWIERSGRLEPTAVRFAGSDEIVALVERAVTPLGLRFDRASPLVDARLPDGSRLHAVMPPASPAFPVVAIRRFTPAAQDLDDLVRLGSASEHEAAMLRDLVGRRRNIIVSGGTGTGKTTMLNVLSREIPRSERVVVVEDAAELALSGHVIRLEARPPNVEGAGAVTIAELLRSGLRLRPDRLVLGEVRGVEALDLLTALNTGHDGSMSTVHANGPEEALLRIETLAASRGGADASAVRRQIDTAVHVVVQLERSGTDRRIARIVERA